MAHQITQTENTVKTPDKPSEAREHPAVREEQSAVTEEQPAEETEQPAEEQKAAKAARPDEDDSRSTPGRRPGHTPERSCATLAMI